MYIVNALYGNKKKEEVLFSVSQGKPSNVIWSMCRSEAQALGMYLICKLKHVLRSLWSVQRTHKINIFKAAIKPSKAAK
jgi:hypothetical protein